MKGFVITKEDALNVETLMRELQLNLRSIEDIATVDNLEQLNTLSVKIFAQHGYDRFWLCAHVNDSLNSIISLGLQNVCQKVFDEYATLVDVARDDPWLKLDGFHHTILWRTAELEKQAHNENARAICDIARRNRMISGMKLPLYDPRHNVAMQFDISSCEDLHHPYERCNLKLMADVVVNRYFELVWGDEPLVLSEHEEQASLFLGHPRAVELLSNRLNISLDASMSLLANARRKTHVLRISQAINHFARGTVLLGL